MKKLITLSCALLLVFGVVGTASALLVNGSFDDTSLTTDPYVILSPASGLLPGWTVVNSDVAWIGPALTQLSAQDGDGFLDLTALDVLPFGGVTQTITTTPGQLYNLSFWLGSSTEFRSGSLTVNIDGVDVGTFGPGSADAANVWEQFSVSFSGSGSTAIIFQGNSADGVKYVGLDNVEVSAAVPEPTTLLLLGTGLIGLAGLSRRKFFKK